VEKPTDEVVSEQNEAADQVEANDATEELQELAGKEIEASVEEPAIEAPEEDSNGGEQLKSKEDNKADEENKNDEKKGINTDDKSKEEKVIFFTLLLLIYNKIKYC